MAQRVAYCVAVNAEVSALEALEAVEQLKEAASAVPVHLTIFEGEIRAVGYTKGTAMRIMLSALDLLMDELGLEPEDIEEPHTYSHELPPPLPQSPRGSGVSLPSGSGVSLPNELMELGTTLRTDTPAPLAVVPAGVPNARTLASLISSGDDVLLCRLSIGVRVHADSSCAWIGLRVWEVRFGEVVIEDLDGHITLMYFKKNAIEDVDLIQDALDRRLSSMMSSTVERRCAFKFNEVFAKDDYAWGDALVASPAHGALHGLVQAAISARSSGSRGLVLKRVP